jgi:hypothetical protein
MTAIPDPTRVPNPDDASMPAMIRVVATMGLILASIGLVSSPFLLLRLTGSSSDAELPLRAPEARWLIITSLSGGGLSGLLLIAATGCMQLRPWGRWAMTLYAVSALLMGLGGSYFYLKWAGLFGEDEVPAAQRGVIGFIALSGWLFGTVYAAWALWAVNRPHAKEAFEGGRPLAT